MLIQAPDYYNATGTGGPVTPKRERITRTKRKADDPKMDVDEHALSFNLSMDKSDNVAGIASVADADEPTKPSRT